MDIQGIIKACPFPPGAHKPKVDHVPRRWRRMLYHNFIRSKSVILVVGFLLVTYLYVNSYGLINTRGKPVLYKDDFLVFLSLGSYFATMLMWYIRRWKTLRKKK